METVGGIFAILSGLFCIGLLGLGGVIAVIVLLLKILVIAEKIAEPEIEDSGNYSLDQGKEPSDKR